MSANWQNKIPKITAKSRSWLIRPDWGKFAAARSALATTAATKPKPTRNKRTAIDRLHRVVTLSTPNRMSQEMTQPIVAITDPTIAKPIIEQRPS